MAPVIGLGMGQDRNSQAPITNAHGFSIEWLRIPPGGRVSSHCLVSKQVLTVYQGNVEILISNVSPANSESALAAVRLGAYGTPDQWDSYAMPADVWRSYRNTGQTHATILFMTAGDAPKPPVWAPEVLAATAAAGFAVDANGLVALKKFTDRSQR